MSPDLISLKFDIISDSRWSRWGIYLCNSVGIHSFWMYSKDISRHVTLYEAWCVHHGNCTVYIFGLNSGPFCHASSSPWDLFMLSCCCFHSIFLMLSYNHWSKFRPFLSKLLQYHQRFEQASRESKVTKKYISQKRETHLAERSFFWMWVWIGHRLQLILGSTALHGTPESVMSCEPGQVQLFYAAPACCHRPLDHWPAVFIQSLSD